jgi:hypothetical protein
MRQGRDDDLKRSAIPRSPGGDENRGVPPEPAKSARDEGVAEEHGPGEIPVISEDAVSERLISTMLSPYQARPNSTM